MDLEDLRDKLKRDFPAIKGYFSKTTSTNNTAINRELNLAAIQVAYDTLCIPHKTSVSLTENDADYDLNSLITNFLRLDEKGGVLFYDGTTYNKLGFTSPDELDENEVDWRSTDAGLPEKCFMEGASLNVWPKPNDDYENGLLIYCGLLPTEMSGDSSDPFNDMTHLKPIHPLVVLWEGCEFKKSQGGTKWKDYDRLIKIYAARVQQFVDFKEGKFEGPHFPDMTILPGYMGSFRSRGR